MVMEPDNTCAGRVLVIDDEESIRDLITGWLEISDFEYECAENGAEALRKLESYTPDIILTDASMPVMGGFETVLKIRENPRLRGVPVIFLTVRDDMQDILNAFDIGVSDYVTKPFKPQILLARVRRAVSSYKFTRNAVARLREVQNVLLETIAPGRKGVMLVDRSGNILAADKQMRSALNAEEEVDFCQLNWDILTGKGETALPQSGEITETVLKNGENNCTVRLSGLPDGRILAEMI